MSTIKRIPIEALKPGMYIIDMDLPWYRTPFLFHKRLIQDAEAIQQMKQHGITTVTIDTSKGRDVESVAAAAQGNSQSQAEGSGADTTQSFSAKEPVSETTATPLTAPQTVYAEAQEAIERIFADLERGVPPTPAETKAVVSRVLPQVLDQRDAMILQGVFRKMMEFDRSIAAHALDTCILSLVVAIESGVDPMLYEHVGVGAFLHDVGFVRLPRNLVRKRSDCTEPERRLMRQHPQLGAALLREQGELHEEVRRIVLEHHEHSDGSGYPHGISAEDLSPLSQLVGIVNYYDNLVSRRGGRPAMTPHDAVRQLFLSGERNHYAKSLVETVIRSIGVYPVGSLVRLNTGEQAVVVGANPTQRLKPQVKIMGGPHGECYANPEQIDLALPGQGGVTRTILRVLDPAQERVNIAMYLGDAVDQAAS